MTDTILSRFSAYQIPLHGVRLPSFVIPQEDRDKLKLDSNASNFEFLRSLCLTGFKKLKLKKDSPEYKAYAERANYELTTLNELGFVDYILLVWVVLNFCKKKGIPTGLGRGSAAGSLVLFLIGVTGIDPIKYDLYFERFISKTRAKKKVVDGITYLDGSLMCDVDIDICYYRRNEVLEYLNTLFAGKVSKILTLNTLSGKLLIKECGKIISNKSETEMNSVAALIPKIFGNVEDIEVAYKDVKEFQEWCDENREVYEVALSLRDLIKNKSVHASGVMLSYDDLSKSCPVEKTTNDEYVSGYDMKWASLMNVKLDCLGLRAVSVVADACKSIGITMADIDVNDPLIYQNLYDLKCPHGIFQIEAHTAFKSLQKIKPKNIEELSAVLAIARPGALQFLDEYANYTNNSTCKTVHPFFDDIFGKTGGQCLYQEQLIAAIRKIGFSAEEGELVRRCVGKKDHKGMAEWEVKIKQKVIDNKLDPQIFDIVWKIAQDSASYSFNKCLSPDTVVETEYGNKLLYEINIGDRVLAYDVDTQNNHFVEVKNVHTNEVELFEVEMEDGRIIKCSMDHKFLCNDNKMHTLKQIIENNLEIVCKD